MPINQGGHYNTTASINTLTETGIITQLPGLMPINWGGHYNTTTTVKTLTEVVASKQPLWLFSAALRPRGVGAQEREWGPRVSRSEKAQRS